MKKIFIQNRHNQAISIIIDQSSDQSGLAFVVHGLGGFKEQDHIVAIAEAFQSCGFTTIRFDTTNTLGESGGRYEDATITNYYEDLEDVIAWASSQDWYQVPFVLSGHSLGATCTTLYAERHPDRVRALAPISPVVSGALSFEAYKRHDAQAFARWEETGRKEDVSNSKPGSVKWLPWSHMVDRMKYDLIVGASSLIMPVILIVGEHDTSTPPDHVRLLFEALPEPKGYFVIKDAPHTFRVKEQLAEIKDLLVTWTDSIG